MKGSPGIIRGIKKIKVTMLTRAMTFLSNRCARYRLLDDAYQSIICHIIASLYRRFTQLWPSASMILSVESK